MDRRRLFTTMALGTLILGLSSGAIAQRQDKRPNILWLVAEDMNPWLSCYGETLIQTPTFDAMAVRKEYGTLDSK